MLARMRRGGHFHVVVPDPDAGPIKKQTVRRVTRTFRPYRGKVSVVGLAIFVTSVLGIVNPLLIKIIFDQDLFGNPPNDCLCRHLQYMPLRFFTNTRTGEIQSRLANDVGGVQSVVTDTAASILSNVVIIISTLVAMLLISWQLTALSLFMLPFFLWLTYKVGKARQEVARSTQKSLADLTAITEETLSVSGILLSKAFGRQRY